ncbi:MAG TPA: hypothetical protein VK427_03755 [Kofleriaceae bacterium]|nr:hypothetical protein [Kofleriaceae bacterium]
MDRVRRAPVALALVATTASADHEHHHTSAEVEDSSVTASLGVLAASYSARLFEGDYQGVSFAGAWSYGRFEVGASVVGYQIDRNGKRYRGAGDVMVHGTARLYERGRATAGAHVMVMVPSGDDDLGVGMGHWMVMTAGWAAWSHRLAALGAAVGYARGIGGAAAHAEHGGGAWPLVDPMTYSEVTYDANAMVPVANAVAVGAGVVGAIPNEGDTRMIGAARFRWRRGPVETMLEAQAGIAGDPVRYRGMLTTSVTF